MKTMIGFSNGKTGDIKMSEQIQAVEVRKRRAQWSRISLSWAIVGTFIFLVYLLLFADIKEDSKDLVNILVGAFVAVLAKSTDYWFKDKDDPEHKEAEALNGNS